MAKTFRKLIVLLCLCAGVGVGYIWGKGVLRQQQAASQAIQSEGNRQYSLLLALVGVAQADGAPTHNKIAAIRQIFLNLGYSGSNLEQIQNILASAIHQPLDLHALAQSYKSTSNEAQRALLLKYAFLIANADGAMSPATEAAMNSLSRDLGF